MTSSLLSFAQIKDRPVRAFLGTAAAALAILGGSAQHAASSVLACFILFSLFNLHRVRSSWRMLATGEKSLLLLFLLYTLTGFISYLNVADTYEYVKYMGRYLRFAFLPLIVLVLLYYRYDLMPFLKAGIVLAGPVYLGYALTSLQIYPELPASWHYHHITFGDAAMVNALLILMMLAIEPWKIHWKILLGVSLLCALYASFLSTARGAWVAIPFGLAVAFLPVLQRRTIPIRYLAGAALLAFVVIAVSPASEIIATRIDQAVDEIEQFRSGSNAATSVGQRFAYWDVAFDIWKRDPFIGTGIGDFDDELYRLQDEGVYPDIEVSGSVHNIYVQAMAETGMLGFAVLVLALVAGPLWFYVRCARQSPVAYYGIQFVIAYAVFGLTETWIFRAPVVAIFIIYNAVFISSCLLDARNRNA